VKIRVLGTLSLSPDILLSCSTYGERLRKNICDWNDYASSEVHDLSDSQELHGETLDMHVASDQAPSEDPSNGPGMKMQKAMNSLQNDLYPD